MGQWVVYLIRNAMEILKKLDEMDTSDVHITLYNWVFLVKILCPNFKLWKNVTELYVLMCKKAGDFCLQLSPKKVPLRWWFWTNRREWKKIPFLGQHGNHFAPINHVENDKHVWNHLVMMPRMKYRGIPLLPNASSENGLGCFHSAYLEGHPSSTVRSSS